MEDDHNLTTVATIVTGIQNNEKDKLEKVCEALLWNNHKEYVCDTLKIATQFSVFRLVKP